VWFGDWIFFSSKKKKKKKKKKDNDECQGQGDGNNCSTNALCTNIPGGFTCQCNDGYSGDGVNCNGNHSFLFYEFNISNNKSKDKNECETGDDNCDEQATCTNTEGSFTCECNIGYSGDGVYCNGNYFFVLFYLIFLWLYWIFFLKNITMWPR